MKRTRLLALACALTLGVCGLLAGRAEAGFPQSYGSWHKGAGYYYRSYNYQPKAYHYVIYYPQQPRYLYYYNPAQKYYWGRFDIKEKGYSMLAVEDRKNLLKDIPESKFPDPGELPPVPDTKDKNEIVKAPPTDDLPKDLPTSEDVPGVKPKETPVTADPPKEGEKPEVKPEPKVEGGGVVKPDDPGPPPPKVDGKPGEGVPPPAGDPKAPPPAKQGFDLPPGTIAPPGKQCDKVCPSLKR